MKLLWMFVALIVGCRGETDDLPDANLIYGEFFQALTKRYGVDGTRGNLVVHHGGDADLGTLVIHSRTSSYREDSKLDIQARLPSLRKDTCDDFWVRNKERRELIVTTAGTWRIRMLRKEEWADLRTLGRTEGDEAFERAYRGRFPDGQLVSLSAPGISRDGSQALLYFSCRIGPMAASGSYYLLEKRGGSWAIKEHALVWIS